MTHRSMLVCRAELQDGRIHRRENQAEILDFTVPCVKTIWLLRQTEEKPVFEVDILYCKNGETKELKLMRFGVDVDGGMNSISSATSPTLSKPPAKKTIL